MQIKTALILCAGFGKRLLPYTLSKPKPLLKLYDKTLLEHSINLIKKLNINKIKLNTYYLKENIESFIKLKKFNMDIEIINDGDEILDTGGGIFNMIKNIDEEDFLVLNPDTYWNFKYVEDITKMESSYFRQNSNIILLVVNKNLSFDKKLTGDFNKIKSYLSKENPRNFIFTGCQILNKKIFSNSNIKKFSMNKIWNNLIDEKKLLGFESKNNFIHITDTEVYQKLLKNN